MTSWPVNWLFGPAFSQRFPCFVLFIQCEHWASFNLLFLCADGLSFVMGHQCIFGGIYASCLVLISIFCGDIIFSPFNMSLYGDIGLSIRNSMGEQHDETRYFGHEVGQRDYENIVHQFRPLG